MNATVEDEIAKGWPGYTNTGRAYHMHAGETARWEDSGREGAEFRSALRRSALRVARAIGNTVELYAAQSEGGWTADQIVPEQWEDAP